MKPIWTLVMAALMAIAILACGLLRPTTPPAGDVSTIVAATLEAATVAAPTQAGSELAPAGTQATFPGGRFVIPAGLASGASSETVPAVAADESMPWWGIAPEHVIVKLQGYALQDKFHEPQIVIYPAEEYAAMNESVADNLRQLRDQLSNPGSLSGPGVPPTVPFFNAGALIGAKAAAIQFQDGAGIRALTEYAQFYAPINNSDLFYHFQGLSSDGRAYIVAILPVTAPLLAAESGPSAVPPAGGVPFPGSEATDESLFVNYYRSVTDMLNAASPDTFQPTLTSLDALIESIEVSH